MMVTGASQVIPLRVKAPFFAVVVLLGVPFT